MIARLRLPVSAGVGFLLALALNVIAVTWMRATTFADDAFADGSAAIVTLALPALLSGFWIGWFARQWGLPVAAATFCLFCLAGFARRFWQVPLVTPRSAHSGLIHYFLYNPLVALGFGALGGWLGGQFSTGRFTLADREPAHIRGMEE